MRGIGTDILHIDRIKNSVQNPEDPYIKRVFTEQEQKLILKKAQPLYGYATRFAGKEAVFKALGADAEHFRLNDIEILERDTGQPYVLLHGMAKELAEKRGIGEILISLSCEYEYAVAFAAAMGKEREDERQNH